VQSASISAAWFAPAIPVGRPSAATAAGANSPSSRRILLGDDQLAYINKSFPKVNFGEDEQTRTAIQDGAKVVSRPPAP